MSADINGISPAVSSPTDSAGSSSDGTDPVHIVICGGTQGERAALVPHLFDRSDDARVMIDVEGDSPGPPVASLQGELLRHIVETPRCRLIFTTASTDSAPFGAALVASAWRARIAIVLVDAATGITHDTHQSASILRLMGVTQLVAAIDTSDPIAFDRDRLMTIDGAFQAMCSTIGFQGAAVAALTNTSAANIAMEGKEPGWSGGAMLREALDAAIGAALRLDRESRAAHVDGTVHADQFAADILWFGPEAMLKGRPYGLVLGSHTVEAQISEIKYALNVETREHVTAKFVKPGDIARCNVSISTQLPIEKFELSSVRGAFVLLDLETRSTVGIGFVAFPLHRSQNVSWQAIAMSTVERSALKGQVGCCLWLTGLSGAGKSTIANLLEQRLYALGRHTYILDGDNVRHGLNRDLGFTEADRVENIRRVAEVARLMVDAGLITIVSLISPFRAERLFARQRFDAGTFLEIFVDTPLDLCEIRDPKGLYRKARSGAIPNFTGITSPYEPPQAPELHLDAAAQPAGQLVEQILQELIERDLVPPSKPRVQRA